MASEKPVTLKDLTILSKDNLPSGGGFMILPSQLGYFDLLRLEIVLEGRVFAGFARGYQPRWVNVLGQQVGLGTPGTGSDYEELKRSLFEEHFDILQKAWTEDTFNFQGKHWQIPTPNIKWPAAEVTRKYGRGINDNDEISEIGIAPPTFEKRIPDLFMPFATSERSIKWGMERGIVPVTIMTHMDVVKEHFRAGMEAANAAGYAQVAEAMAALLKKAGAV